MRAVYKKHPPPPSLRPILSEFLRESPRDYQVLSTINTYVSESLAGVALHYLRKYYKKRITWIFSLLLPDPSWLGRGASVVRVHKVYVSKILVIFKHSCAHLRGDIVATTEKFDPVPNLMLGYAFDYTRYTSSRIGVTSSLGIKVV